MKRTSHWFRLPATYHGWKCRSCGLINSKHNPTTCVRCQTKKPLASDWAELQAQQPSQSEEPTCQDANQ